MAQPKKSFLNVLTVWKRKHWVLFASEKNKKFWCNLSGQYKITLRPDLTSTSKIIYIGENVREAYKTWLDD